MQQVTSSMRLEILESLQAAAVQDTSRLLLSADDALDGSVCTVEDDEDDYNGLGQLPPLRTQVRHQLKTSGLRKGKRERTPESRSHIGGGKCRALNERTAHLLKTITERLELDEVHEQMRIHRDHNSHAYCVTSRDKTTSYVIKINTNDKWQQLKTWAQSEFKLLSQAYDKGHHVPEPVLCLDHILVTRSVTVGSPPERRLVPPLQEINTKAHHDMHLCYSRVLECMRKLYQDLGIIHGNINENTVLYDNAQFNAKCWLTDFGHAVDTQQSSHLELLAQDVARVNAFFLKHGLRREEMFSSGVLPDDVVLAFVTTKCLKKGYGKYLAYTCRSFKYDGILVTFHAYR